MSGGRKNVSRQTFLASSSLFFRFAFVRLGSDFFRCDISVIRPIILFKLAVTIFTNLYFRPKKFRSTTEKMKPN